MRTEVGKIKGGGHIFRCRIYRTDDRHRAIRVGESTRFVHIDFESIQIRSRVQWGLIGVRSRRFPTQYLGGERSSFGGRTSTASPTTGEISQYQYGYERKK